MDLGLNHAATASGQKMIHFWEEKLLSFIFLYSVYYNLMFDLFIIFCL